jgi:hypothetical protein
MNRSESLYILILSESCIGIMVLNFGAGVFPLFIMSKRFSPGQYRATLLLIDPWYDDGVEREGALYISNLTSK